MNMWFQVTKPKDKFYFPSILESIKSKVCYYYCSIVFALSQNHLYQKMLKKDKDGNNVDGIHMNLLLYLTFDRVFSMRIVSCH